MKQKNTRTCYSALVQFRNYFLNSPEYRKLKKTSWAREPELVGGLVGTITMILFAIFIIIVELSGSDTMYHPAVTLSRVYIAFNIALIIVVSVFGHGDVWSRNDFADYQRLGNEIDRLIYDIVTRRRDESEAYHFSMEELDNDIKSIASVLNGMARNFRSVITMNSQFKEFAKYMRTFESSENDVTDIEKSVEKLNSFVIPEFTQIHEFVKAIVFYDINRIDGTLLPEITSEQNTIVNDYAYTIKNSEWLRQRLEEFCANEFSNPNENVTRYYPLITASCYFEASGFDQKRINKLCKRIKKRKLRESKESENEKVNWI